MFVLGFYLSDSTDSVTSLISHVLPWPPDFFSQKKNVVLNIDMFTSTCKHKHVNVVFYLPLLLFVTHLLQINKAISLFFTVMPVTYSLKRSSKAVSL